MLNLDILLQGHSMFATKYKLLVLQLLYVDNRFQIQLTIHTYYQLACTPWQQFKENLHPVMLIRFVSQNSSNEHTPGGRRLKRL